jgi:hypothetical protein
MSSSDFKYDVEFYRHAIGKAGDPAKEKQVTRLYRLYVSAEWCRGGWKLYTEVLQPAICSAQR